MSRGSVLLASVRALLGRAESLAREATAGAQTGVLAGGLLDKVAAALRGAVAAIEQLDASVGALRAMGL